MSSEIFVVNFRYSNSRTLVMQKKWSLETFRRKKTLKVLKNTQAEKFVRSVPKNLIRRYEQARKHSPAYADITKDLPPVRSPEEFGEHVPLLNKENYYSKYTLKELAGEKYRDIKLAMTSSGYSGTFAYGFSSGKDARSFRRGVDISFEYCFGISDRSTFLINCEPMGVHLETSLPIAETSVRSDMAVALLKKVSPLYDQTILIGDPYFMKKVIEEGDDEKINWSRLKVSLVTGQDWLPESLRSYLARRLEITLDEDTDRAIYTTMGMAEIGMNLFHESARLVKIRRAVARDKQLKAKLTGSDMISPPLFYHYYPFRTFIESVNSELIFTSLSSGNIIPIIRYATGDSGSLLTWEELVKLLGPSHKDVIPDLQLPIGIIYGRTKNRLKADGRNLHIEDIKEALFLNNEIAASVTGLLKAELTDGNLLVHLHLKEKLKPETALKKTAEKEISDFLQFPVSVKLYSYNNFPKALELSYEHKLFPRW